MQFCVSEDVLIKIRQSHISRLKLKTPATCWFKISKSLASFLECACACCIRFSSLHSTSRPASAAAVDSLSTSACNSLISSFSSTSMATWFWWTSFTFNQRDPKVTHERFNPITALTRIVPYASNKLQLMLLKNFSSLTRFARLVVHISLVWCHQCFLATQTRQEQLGVWCGLVGRNVTVTKAAITEAVKNVFLVKTTLQTWGRDVFHNRKKANSSSQALHPTVTSAELDKI